MLPIASTSSATSLQKSSTSTTALRSVSPVEEAEGLSGEWQQAKSQRGRAQTRRIYEGELVHDQAAVEGYLCAAGERRTVALGQIISVYA